MPQPNGNPPNAAQNPDQLNGWKDIAAFLGKSVRTVQRWEKELELPVHRIHTPGGEIIYTSKEEISEWMARGIPADLDSDKKTRPQLTDTSLSQDAASATSKATRVGVPPLLLRWGIVAIVLVAVTFIWWRVSAAPPGVPTSFDVIGQTLVVKDHLQEEIWSRDFPTLFENHYRNALRASRKNDVGFFADLDGDGAVEFLFVLTMSAQADRMDSYLVCFDQNGQERWSYRPETPKRYGNQQYAPPFVVQFARIFQDTEGLSKVLWVVSHHNPWFPTVVAKIDSHGKVLGEYWHAGHVNSLSFGSRGDRKVVFVGGTNNELLAAALSVIDFDNPEGHSPASNPEYLCQNCPAPSPLVYIVFPRSELASVLNVRPSVYSAWQRSRSEIEVMIGGVSTPSGKSFGEAYSFDSEFRLLDAEIAEGYVDAHNEMQARGIIKHALDRKRESLALRGVRYWNGKEFVSTPPGIPSAKAFASVPKP